MTDHQMVCTERTGSGSSFECTAAGCGRRVVLHAGGGRTVVQAGDAWAPHRGGYGIVVGAGLDGSPG